VLRPAPAAHRGVGTLWTIRPRWGSAAEASTGPLTTWCSQRLLRLGGTAPPAPRCERCSRRGAASLSSASGHIEPGTDALARGDQRSSIARVCRKQSRCLSQRSTATRPPTRPVRSRPTLLSPLSSSPSWFGSYDSDALCPARRQNATLPSRRFSAVVVKTDSVRQTRFPDALRITRARDLRRADRSTQVDRRSRSSRKASGTSVQSYGEALS